LTWIIDELTNLGFAPEAPRGPRDSTIRLRHCPFLELVTGAQISTDNGQASGYGAVICSLHLGLMQGSLASLHGPMTVDRLDPFVEPDLCVAHLTASATASLQAAGDEEGA
jgi:predicted ArsR family transcriptional regulator